MSFEASYSGTCGGCDQWFPKGTEVAFHEDGVLVIASHFRELDPKPVCQTCFMQLPATGKCDTCEG
jgi:hypothetical protein